MEKFSLGGCFPWQLLFFGELPSSLRVFILDHLSTESVQTALYCDSTFTDWPSNGNWQVWFGSCLRMLGIGWLPPKLSSLSFHSLMHSVLFLSLLLINFFNQYHSQNFCIFYMYSLSIPSSFIPHLRTFSHSAPFSLSLIHILCTIFMFHFFLILSLPAHSLFGPKHGSCSSM